MSRAIGDSRVYRVLQLLGDLVVINVLTVVGILPVITAGASLTAGLACCMRMVEGREGHVAAQWWAAFRRSGRHTTLTWILAVALTGLLAWEWLAAGYLASTMLARASMVVVTIAALLLSLVMAWYLPIAARDALSSPGAAGASRLLPEVARRWRQALLASVRLLPRSVLVLVVTWGPVALAASAPGVGARLLLGAVVILVALVLYLVVLVVRTPLGLAEPADDDPEGNPARQHW